ncbi:MAG: hypothetical protein HC890_00330 [Chloroflexaceae bacterium]|nr:hypothetical protein [Chloroflexaceae bacterium]
MGESLLNWLGDRNPQLFRELKGRLTNGKLAIAAGLSAIGQLFLVLLYQAALPTEPGNYSRYCGGTGNCFIDDFGDLVLNLKLWWLDLYVDLSLIGIFVLLVGGTYLLIADLAQEEQRGTLNFVRYSPRSASNILLGKLLGTPVLLYVVAAIAMPLHLMAGLSGGIPPLEIVEFYGILAASCIFFYSLALLEGLVSHKLGIFQAFLGSGAVLLFLTILTLTTLNFIEPTALDWLRLFYPGTLLPHLVKASFLPASDIGLLANGTLDANELAKIHWYGQAIFAHGASTITFVLLNCGLWSYWVWQGLKRYFHNPGATVLSKKQSYWITGFFVVSTLGFVPPRVSSVDYLLGNFALVMLFQAMLFLILMAALSPQRQALRDWARYRHQQGRGGLLADLLWGEKSPSTLAIALNLALITAYILPAVLIWPLGQHRLALLSGLVLFAGVILIHAAIAQLILLQRTSKRVLIATATVGFLAVIPLIGSLFIGWATSTAPWLMFFSFIPLVATHNGSVTTMAFALLGQWLVITLVSVQMTRQLRLAGQSETRALLQGQ